MPDYVVSDTSLTSVANAIRTKGGTSGTLSFPDGFISAISAIPSGGGASNCITGEFKGTITGQALDVTIPYSGDGFPIAVLIYPKGGIGANSTFRDAIQRYAGAIYSMVKTYMTNSPEYELTGQYSNYGNVVMTYKANSTSATSYAAKELSFTSAYSSSDATNTIGQSVRIKSPTKMSVFIASNSYGFMANIDYTYHVIYSN